MTVKSFAPLLMAIAFGGGTGIVVSSLIGSIGRKQELRSNASRETENGVVEELARGRNEPLQPEPASVAASAPSPKKEKARKQSKRKPNETDDEYAARIARRRDRMLKRMSINQPGGAALL